MTEALVTPGILSWARTRRGLDVGEVAAKLNVKAEAVDSWEEGTKRPTFRQAQRFAQAMYIPLGYLYLSEPPEETMPLADFRTIPGQPPREPSPDFLDLLSDVLGKQEWFREYQQSQGVEELPFVGRFNPTSLEDEVAADIRAVIDVDGARQRAPNWEGFMRELTRNAEHVGVMVMRSGVVANNNHRPLDVEEFRGFSISDSIAPLIFINARDFRGAQIFTFTHELAHIWSGEGGVSNPNYALQDDHQDISIERFCNRVAAETLVPGEEFRAMWEPNFADLETQLRSLGSYYKVSQIVILRQAWDNDFLSAPVYRENYRRIVEQASQGGTSGESGGNFHYTLAARNGGAFTQAVISGAVEGNLLSSEAADMLGVKVKTLPSLAEHLYGSPLNLG